MAANDKLPTNDSLEGTDANSGVPTVCLEGLVTNQTRPTPGVAIPGEPTKTDRNSPSDADTPRSVQSTRLVTYTSTEEHARELDALSSLRKVLRAVVTRLIKEATQLYQSTSPSPHDLQEAIDQLASKQCALKKLDKIGEPLEGEEFDQDFSDAIEYQERICRARSWLRSTLNNLRAPGSKCTGKSTSRPDGPYHVGSRTSVSRVQPNSIAMNYKRRFFPDIVNVVNKANSLEPSLVSAQRQNERTIKNKRPKDSDNEPVLAAPKKKMGGFALLNDRDDGDDDEGDKNVDSAKEDVKEPEKVVKEGKKEKRKKEKKRKNEEDIKNKLKGPGSEKIVAIQEHLRKKEEEIKAGEDAERLRAEKLKQEQERKEFKNQKKERRERAKADGQLLTKALKKARARMEATLKALKEQGIEVPHIGEKKITNNTDRRRIQRLNKRPGEEAGEADKKADTTPEVQREILRPDGTVSSEKNDQQKVMSLHRSNGKTRKLRLARHHFQFRCLKRLGLETFQ